METNITVEIFSKFLDQLISFEMITIDPEIC